MGVFNKKSENGCPDKEIFIRAFLEDISLEEREKLVDHVLSCPKCKIIFDVIRQLSIELLVRSKDLGEKELLPAEIKQFRKVASKKIREQKKIDKRKLFGRLRFEYIVPVIVLLFVVVGYLYFSNVPGHERYRTPEMEKLRLLEPSGKISAPPLVFIWAPVTNIKGLYYKFELIDDELNTLFEKQLYHCTLSIPESLRTKLKKGRTYIWKVEAFDSENRKIDSNIKYFVIE